MRAKRLKKPTRIIFHVMVYQFYHIVIARLFGHTYCCNTEQMTTKNYHSTLIHLFLMPFRMECGLNRLNLDNHFTT